MFIPSFHIEAKKNTYAPYPPILQSNTSPPTPPNSLTPPLPPAYNDIPPMNYASLLPLFSPPPNGTPNSAHNGEPSEPTTPPTTYRRATTKPELDTALSSDALINISAGSTPQVLEVCMDAFDIPWRLARLLKRRSPGYLRREGFSNAV